jgi:hypothetical protein
LGGGWWNRDKNMNPATDAATKAGVNGKETTETP